MWVTVQTPKAETQSNDRVNYKDTSNYEASIGFFANGRGSKGSLTKVIIPRDPHRLKIEGRSLRGLKYVCRLEETSLHF